MNQIIIPKLFYRQQDIGLEKYKVADLFLHLVGPTIIVIMTIIQLQYFHDKYIKMLEFTNQNTDNSRATDTSRGGAQDATELDYDNVEDPTIRTNTDRPDKNDKTIWVKLKATTRAQAKQYILNAWEFTWLFLEIHLIKVVILTAFLICVDKVKRFLSLV